MLRVTQSVDVIDVAGELMLVSGISSNGLTVTSGQGMAVPQPLLHADGELVRLVKGNASIEDDTVTQVNDGSGLASDATVTTATVDSL